MLRTAWTATAATVAAGLILLAWRGGDPAPRAAAGGTKVALFDGKDLAGWVQFLPDHADPAKTWSVQDGVIRCTGQPVGYLRTEKTFKNYFLVVEWRWPEQPGNSGVLLHMQREDKVWPYSIEAQLESGNAGDFWFIDGAEVKIDESRRNPDVKRNIKHIAGAEKPP